MVHRQYSSGSQSFENGDQRWNNMPVEQADMELARGNSVQNRAFIYPVDNINQEAAQFASPWNAPRPSGFVPFGHNDGSQHHQSNIATLSEDHFIHQSSVGAFKSASENFDSHASSSNYDCHPFYGADGSFITSNVDAGTRCQKRKSPMIPSVCEAGTSSRYYFSGSSSNFHMSSEIQQDKPSNDGYNYNGLSARGEGSLRNMRTRSVIDPDYNDARVSVPTNRSHTSFYTSNAVEHSSMVNHQGQTPNALTSNWNHTIISPAHGRVITTDSGGFRFELGHPLDGSSGSAPFEAACSDIISGRNSVARHSFHGSSSQSLRSSRSSYSQRSSRDFRHSSNGMHSGHTGLSEERLHSVPDGYLRHRRPLSAVGWHHGDRNRRSRVCHERYRSFHDQESGHDHQLDYEGLVDMDRATFYASRNVYDQHRDLRLDIDNMSYEELLALGERIGSVNTGLSEDSVKKCLLESLYYSYGQPLDDGRCVICLEEYENMDKIGKLKACGHDYHVSCIRKWLSMKNLCPICKAPALENVKQK